MTCPTCGATNPPQAQWCGQCYASFAEPPTPQTPDRTPEPAAPDGAAPQADRATSSGFRRVGERLEWACVTCGAFNDLDLLTCSVCGTPLSARYEDTAEDPAERSWNAAFALSAVLPGAGHVAVGRPGTGLARMVLFAVWLVGGLQLSSAGGGRAAAAAAPLFLGSAILWAGSLLDLVLLRRGDRELLGGRMLLWLVVAVLVLSALGMFALATG